MRRARSGSRRASGGSCRSSTKAPRTASQSRALAPGGEVGRVWALRRPLVYRTLEQLEARALTRVAGVEPSDAGPPRTLLVDALTR